MNTKTLIGLGIAVVVLAVLVVIRNQAQQPRSILDQVSLEPLVPAGLGTDEIHRLELYAGAAPEDRLVLIRDANDPEQWRLATHFDAPVDPQRIEQFLANAVGMRGEYRTNATTDEALAPFDLTDEAAFHVVGFGSSDDAARFHVLVGKSPSFRTVFVRRAGEPTVFVEEINLRHDAGVHAVEPLPGVDSPTPVAPPADPWIRKEIVSVASEDIETIEVTTPGRAIALARREPEPAPDGDEEVDEDVEAISVFPDPAAPEWLLAAGGPGPGGGNPKPAGVTSLLNRFANLRGETVVDPSQAAELGLEPPAYTVAITVANEDAPIILEGGRPDPNGPAYLRLAGSPHIYQVAAFAFEGIFPRASQLFDLPAVDLPLSALSEVISEGPGGRIHLRKGEEDEWVIVAPSAPLPVQQFALDDLARAASVWNPVDYVDEGVETGLDAPRYTVTAIRDDGESVAVRVGNPSPQGGHFVGFDASPVALRMSQTDFDQLFPHPRDLYQRALTAFEADEVVGVTVEDAAASFTLAREDADNGWLLTVDGAAHAADPAAVSAILRALTGLQASDIRFGQSEPPTAPASSVAISLADGSAVEMALGPAEDGERWLTLDGMAGVFAVTEIDAVRLLPAMDALRAEIPEEEIGMEPDEADPAS